MRWITAPQLENWARGTPARDELPKIVADLIRASSPDIASMRFPSGDKGQVREFDGHLVSYVKALNVPQGQSFWEISTEQDYRHGSRRERLLLLGKKFSTSMALNWRHGWSSGLRYRRGTRERPYTFFLLTESEAPTSSGRILPGDTGRRLPKKSCYVSVTRQSSSSFKILWRPSGTTLLVARLAR